MKRILRRYLLVPVLLAFTACQSESPQPVEQREPEVEVTHTPADQAHGHAAEHGEDGESLPLRPIMLMLASDLAAFTHALWLEDYEVMTERSASIAHHPHISQEEIQRIQSILGDEMHTFEELDENVHHGAERLHQAAESRQLDDVLARLSELQNGCMACHSQFRERLRTDTAPAGQ